RPQLASALQMHFAGKVPALRGRRSAWPVRPLGLQVAEILAEPSQWDQTRHRCCEILGSVLPRRSLHVPMAWFLPLDSALVNGGTENQEVNGENANGQLVAQAIRFWKGSDVGTGRGFAALDCAGGNREQ